MFCQRCGTEVPENASACSACGFHFGATTPMKAVPDVGKLSDIEIVRATLSDDYDGFEEVGRGGMAIVFRAREKMLHREVALKVLPFRFAFDPEFVERFQREARTAASLEHPYIIPVYRVGKKDNVIFLAMKFLRGKSLAQLIREQGALDPAEIVRILIQAADALGYAHRHNVVHRDVKPDNIIFTDPTPDADAVVCDFGIAKASSSTQLTGTGMVIGTPYYMSPEQVRTQHLDGRSDLYSLGVVAYQCLTGSVPFKGDDSFTIGFKHIHDPVPIPDLPTDGARKLFGVINRMMAKDPKDRYQNAEALITELERMAEEQPPPPVRSEPLKTARRVSANRAAATPNTPTRTGIGQMTASRRSRGRSRSFPRLGALLIVLLGGLGGAGYYYLEFMDGTIPLVGIGMPSDTTVSVAPPPENDTLMTLSSTALDSTPASTAADPEPVPGDTGSNQPDTLAAPPADSAPAVVAPDTAVVTPEVTDGMLVVSGLGPNARVFINGVSVRGLEHSVPAGRHQILAQRDGYRDYRQGVEVPAGDTVRVVVRWVAVPAPSSQCESFDDSYNRNGECFDQRPRPHEAPIVPLDVTVPTKPAQPAILAIQVNVDGTVRQVVVKEGSDVPEFTILAVEFARNLTFDAAIKDGRPIVGWTQQAFIAR